MERTRGQEPCEETITSRCVTNLNNQLQATLRVIRRRNERNAQKKSERLGCLYKNNVFKFVALQQVIEEIPLMQLYWFQWRQSCPFIRLYKCKCATNDVSVTKWLDDLAVSSTDRSRAHPAPSPQPPTPSVPRSIAAGSIKATKIPALTGNLTSEVHRTQLRSDWSISDFPVVTDQIGGACSTHGRDQKCIQKVGYQKWKETTSKTYAWMGGKY